MNEDKKGIDITVEIGDQQEEYKEWLVFAKTDYECAKYLNGAPFHPRPLNVICYHCQQAAEKAVKALIVYFGSLGGMPKLHDIQFLLGQVRHLVKERKGIVIEESLMDIAESLSKYGVAPRYPNEIEVNEDSVKKALKDADTVLSWVIGVISEPDKTEDK